MKRVIIMFLCFISTFTLISSQIYNNNLKRINTSIKDVYIDYGSSYYEEKYDLYNSSNRIIRIEESLSGDRVGQLSTKRRSFFSMLVDKDNREMHLSLNDSTGFDGVYCVELHLDYNNDEWYITSEYSSIKMQELEDYLFNDRCSATCILDLYGFDYLLGGSGGSLVGLFGGAVGAGVIGTTIYYCSQAISNDANIKAEVKAEQKRQLALNSQIDDCLEDLLNGLDNTFGWTKKDLRDALDNAIKISIAGKLEKVLLKQIKQNRPTVVLGKYIDKDVTDEYGNKALQRKDSYDMVAITKPNSMIFSTSEWESLVKAHSKFGMWILNMAFLTVCIDVFNAKFLLTANPDYYFIPGDDFNALSDYYTKELWYIYFRGYRWDELKSKELGQWCEIIADRPNMNIA